VRLLHVSGVVSIEAILAALDFPVLLDGVFFMPRLDGLFFAIRKPQTSAAPYPDPR